jgi:hypothetical protein
LIGGFWLVHRYGRRAAAAAEPAGGE